MPEKTIEFSRQAAIQLAIFKQSKSVTLNTLVAATGMSKSGISRIITGERCAISLDEYINLLRALGEEPSQAFIHLLKSAEPA